MNWVIGSASLETMCVCYVHDARLKPNRIASTLQFFFCFVFRKMNWTGLSSLSWSDKASNMSIPDFNCNELNQQKKTFFFWSSSVRLVGVVTECWQTLEIWFFRIWTTERAKSIKFYWKQWCSSGRIWLQAIKMQIQH